MNENNTNCNAMQEENKKAVAWLTLGHGMADSYSGFINPILPFIVANIGTTLAAATCALSASQLFSSMMQPVFGFIADKWRKRFFIFRSGNTPDSGGIFIQKHLLFFV